MVERSKIEKLVKQVISKNGLHSCFAPIIEEFFFRLADQLEWNEEKLNNAVNRYKKVVSIRFVNMYKKLGLFKKRKIGAGETTYDFVKKGIYIFFDVDDLKSILKFDKEEIEKFINKAMHEQGHSIQFLEKKNKLNAGLQEYIIINNKIFTKDDIIDEFAEVVNATRLQYGDSERNGYFGYENMQNATKIVLSSLGISKVELANIQFEPDARAEYEKLVANKLRSIPSEAYRDGFGKILDSIYIFSKRENQRKNIILQIDSLQTFSRVLFNDRFNDIRMNSDNMLTDLARLCIEQNNKENALKNLFCQFNIKNSELQIKSNKNIYIKLLELGFDAKYLTKLYETECKERVKIQQQKGKQKHYDNEELIEKLYQSFLKYPIKNVALKDRPSVILSKVLGKIKRAR